MNQQSSHGMTITPTAESFIRRLLRMSGQPGSGFQLKVSPGGCAGLSAEFSVEAAPKPADHSVTVNGITLFLSESSYRLLEGVTIDFVDNRMESGFRFIDPKAEECSCKTGSQGVQLSTAGFGN